MRGLLIVRLWLAAGLCIFAMPASAQDRVLRAGAIAIDISPVELPVSINGGMTDRQATGIHDPLYARCLVLDDGTTTLALTICDSCMIPRELFDAAKREAAARTGIPAANMLMSATHTHEAVTVAGVFQSEPEPKYAELLVARIADAVELAWRQREPARIAWTVGIDGSQLFNRRWFTQPGQVNEDPFGGTTDVVRMNPGFAKEVLKEPAGPIDPQVGVISVQSTAGRPIAVWANYSLHYVGDVPGTLLSGDYFGVFAERIASRMSATSVEPAFVGMMSNATSGNINNVDFATGPRPPRAPLEQSSAVATSVADAVWRALQGAAYHTWVPLDVRQTEIELGVRAPSVADVERAKSLLAKAGPGQYTKLPEIYARETVLLAEYPATVPVVLQALRIGDVALVSSPCETFVETGLAIKEASPFLPTFVVELANGYNGYLPTPEHHRLGGYETWRARSSYLAVDAEPMLREALLALLEELAAAR
ncbi:MAG: hypothetical protein KF774_16320 [Planctomyces sp.]|nr:hypothetical protein [Planctomyces sp.]